MLSAQVISGSWDNTVKVWANGICVETLTEGVEGCVQGLAVTPCGRVIYGSTANFYIHLYPDNAAYQVTEYKIQVWVNCQVMEKSMALQVGRQKAVRDVVDVIIEYL